MINFFKHIYFSRILKRKTRELLQLHKNNGVRAATGLREWLSPERIEKYTKCGLMKPSDSYHNTYPHCNRLIAEVGYVIKLVKQEMK